MPLINAHPDVSSGARGLVFMHLINAHPEVSTRTRGLIFMPLINAHLELSRRARGLIFDLRLHPYFVFASSEGIGESAHMHIPAFIFTA